LTRSRGRRGAAAACRGRRAGGGAPVL